MGPSQICGRPFREPRVFTIAHIYIYIHTVTYIYNYIILYIYGFVWKWGFINHLGYPHFTPSFHVHRSLGPNPTQALLCGVLGSAWQRVGHVRKLNHADFWRLKVNHTSCWKLGTVPLKSMVLSWFMMIYHGASSFSQSSRAIQEV